MHKLALLIGTIALIISVLALLQANSAKQMALSEIVVEERDNLVTPVYDQGLEKMTFLAIYELGFTNMSGPDVKVTKIEKIRDTGFVLSLSGNQVVDIDLDAKVFLVEPMLTELQQNPKLIPGLSDKAFDESVAVDLPLQLGKSSTLRVGVNLNPYDALRQSQVSMVLVSFQVEFSNGKTWQFRRGIPIPNLTEQETR